MGATTINSFDYTYDRVGNRKTKADRNGTASYTYDTLNRLIEAINPLPTNPLETYTYDAVGNRTNSNQNGSPTFTSVFNSANQLLEDANFTYQYDANGNQIRKTNKTTSEFMTFEYTAENQLVRVVRNGTTINYRHDGLGRRVEKEVNDGATTKVTRFIHDAEDILLELDGSNNIVARYTHGPGIDEPLILEKSGQSFFYHADGLGSITELTDASGAVAKSYSYSSFGKIESETNPTLFQPYTFTSREFDPETGLLHLRNRYYDPLTGTFTTQDPLGLVAGLNLYVYVHNNPVTLLDPYGLLSWSWRGAAGGFFTGVIEGGIGGTIGGFVGGGASFVGAVKGAAVGAAVGGLGGAIVGGLGAEGGSQGAIGGAIGGAIAGSAGGFSGAIGGAVGGAISGVAGCQSIACGAVVGTLSGLTAGAISGFFDGGTGGAVRGALIGGFAGSIGGIIQGILAQGPPPAEAFAFDGCP